MTSTAEPTESASLSKNTSHLPYGIIVLLFSVFSWLSAYALYLFLIQYQEPAPLALAILPYILFLAGPLVTFIFVYQWQSM